MSLLDAFLQEATPFNVWIAARTDGVRGSGTTQDPFNGATRRNPNISVGLTRGSPPSAITREAIVNTEPISHGFAEGDMVEISGVSGVDEELWNGTFGIYSVTQFSFKYLMKKEPDPLVLGSPMCARLTFPFDEIMRTIPPNTRIQLGPGVFQTRGFAPGDARGFQAKSGWKIVGAGIDVTVLQLVGAENADQHYHIIGMPIEPSGTAPVTPLEHFEVSDLTLDCNADSQPGRPDPGYAPVACGAVRILGNHGRVRDVKAINWGTKSFQQGCFVISLIGASGKPTGEDQQPIITETVHSGIEDCIAIEPSKNNAREVTVLHIGGLKNAENEAQGFAQAPFVRRNFVDCQYLTSGGVGQTPVAFPSAFLTSKSGTQIAGPVGTFVGKRAFVWNDLDVGSYVRLYNPRDPQSRWNGYFPILTVTPSFQVDLADSQGSTDDSSLVIMGTEFRAIAISSCHSAVVEENQIHNCWIGGPYQSLLDDSVTQPSTPPTLATEERLDPLNALNTQDLIVRDNYYRNVAAGPYWNMGGVSGAVANNNLSYAPGTGLVTVTTAKHHHIWDNARVKIESASDARFEGLHEITAVTATTFQYQLAPDFSDLSSGTASCRVVSGVDYLLIEGNLIELADLDEIEFAIKEYPLAAAPAAQTYRACGIVMADNGLCTRAGPHAHGQVILRNNKIRYVDGQRAATVAGIGLPAGAAMQLAGIKRLQVTHNVVDLNARRRLPSFRCGLVRFFNNQRPGGVVVPGWIWDVNGYYDEPETVAEDAFILSLLRRRRR